MLILGVCGSADLLQFVHPTGVRNVLLVDDHSNVEDNKPYISLGREQDVGEDRSYEWSRQNDSQYPYYRERLKN